MKKVWRTRCIKFLLTVIMAMLLMPASITQATEQGEPNEGQPKTGVEITSTTMMYAVKKVNIRQSPDTSAAQIGQLEEGEKIFAVELTEEGWYRVVYNGEKGYVRKDFLAVYTAAEGDWDENSPDEMDINDLEDPEGTGDGSEGQESQPSESQPEGTEQEPAVQEEANAGDGRESSTEVTPQPEQEKKKEKSGISNIMIIAAVVVIILIYGAVQIVKEQKGGNGEEDGSDKEDAGDGEADGSDKEDKANDNDKVKGNEKPSNKNDTKGNPLKKDNKSRDGESIKDKESAQKDNSTRKTSADNRKEKGTNTKGKQAENEDDLVIIDLDAEAAEDAKGAKR